MNIDLPEYIDAPIREKLEKIKAKVIENLPDNESPNGIFVSTKSTQGSLSYLGIWLFTPRLVVEIRNPLSKARIQYEMARLRDAVDWIRLNARNYDFKDHRADSELDLEFTTEDGLSSVLSANGEGCPTLMEVYRDSFLPNFTGTRDNVEQAAEE